MQRSEGHEAQEEDKNEDADMLAPLHGDETISVSSEDESDDQGDQATLSQRKSGVQTLSTKKIAKQKGFTKSQVYNRETCRFNQILRCNTCSKKFTKLCNVIDHVRTHAGYRPFPCELCGQSFAQRGNRDRHQSKRVCLRNHVSQRTK